MSLDILKLYCQYPTMIFWLFLENDLQTPPPSTRADGNIFLAYVSDDFKIFFFGTLNKKFFIENWGDYVSKMTITRKIKIEKI